MSTKTRGRPKTTDKDTKYRNLAVSPAIQQSLENVRNITSATSDAEVFRRALEIYEAILTKGDGSGEISIATKNGPMLMLAR